LGSPRRFRYFAEELAKHGVDSVALLLPGHGGTARDFYRSQRGSRAAYVKARVRQAMQTHKRVFVVGYSLGGLLGLDCALEGLVSGVVLVSTPIRYHINFKAVAHSMKMMLAPAEADGEYMQAYRENNSITGASLLSYPLWLGQYAEMLHYMKNIRSRLKGVRARVLVVQSQKDESIHALCAELIRDGLVNAEVEYVELRESGHGFFAEQDKRRLLDAMLEFIASARPKY
jgi:carboxylesterase